jgi:hypothetical protein
VSRSGLLVFSVLLAMTSRCNGQESQDDGRWRKLREHMTFNVQALTFATESRVIRSSLLNPENQFAGIPAGAATVELRPNVRWSQGIFTVIVKPRFVGVVEGGGTQPDSAEVFMQEWAARATPIRGFTLSYGREVLQWGPSMSISPSNPFFMLNGRDNPIKEIGGGDFFRAVYSPNSKYSVSYLWNVADGRIQPGGGPFRRIQALKVDYTPRSASASLVVSKKDGAPARIGGFFQVTASNALLLYVEGSLHLGSEALYPYLDASGGLWQMAALKSGFHHLYSTSVLGGAYTLGSGATLTTEYIINRDGYSNLEASRYFQLSEQNSQMLLSGASQSGTAAATLTAALNPGLLLLRRNYFFIQFLQTNYRQRADLMVRYTGNVDDRSGTLAAYATLNCTDRMQFFVLGMVNQGGNRTEAGRLLRHQAMAGIRFFLK